MPALSGVTVVVTRPAHQAENLCQLIESEGGKALRFPVIEILPPENPQRCQAQLANLAGTDFAIFVSANAVTSAAAMLDEGWALPESVHVVAVGKATAKAVENAGFRDVLIAPPPFNSEAVLSLPELENINGKKILIFRGNGGRDLLRERLCERGARVDYVECYQRALPQTDTHPLYLVWEQVGSSSIPVVITSNQGLQNFVSLVDDEHSRDMLSSPLIVVSNRALKLAHQLRFTDVPIVADAANDDAILSALKTWVKE